MARAHLLAAVCLVACSHGGWPDVIAAKDVPVPSGAPVISSVVDLGDLGEIPATGALPRADSDKLFVIGELMLIRGEDLGRQPTIKVGGRPTRVVARTEGGGIIVRVPDGTPVGRAVVEIEHAQGRGEAPIEVRRLGLLADPNGNAVHVFEVTPKGVSIRPGPLQIENPRAVRFSADGSMAYVASGFAGTREGGRLSAIAMTAAAGPRVVQEVPTAGRFVVALAAAADAPRMIVVSEDKLQSFALLDPRRPARSDAAPLPPEIAKAGVVAADLAPGGKILAVLLGDGNRLASLDVSDPERPRVITITSLHPEERLPLVRDMRFGPDGQTLWIVSGDNPASLSAGAKPTRLTAVRLSRGESEGPVLALWRTGLVPGVAAPLQITVARGQPTSEGAIVPTPPESAAVFVSAMPPALFELTKLDLYSDAGRARATAILKGAPEPGMIVRTDLDGRGGVLVNLPFVVSSVDLSPDTQLLVGTACKLSVVEGRLAFEFGLFSLPLWQEPRPEFVKLADLRPDGFQPRFPIGHIRIQP